MSLSKLMVKLKKASFHTKKLTANIVQLLEIWQFYRSEYMSLWSLKGRIVKMKQICSRIQSLMYLDQELQASDSDHYILFKLLLNPLIHLSTLH
jgi:hypothetical protein